MAKTPPPPVVNPYAKKDKARPTSWGNRWKQTAPDNDRKGHRIFAAADPMANVGGTLYYETKAKPPSVSISPDPSNPNFFLATQYTSSEETTDSEAEGGPRVDLTQRSSARRVDPPASHVPKKRSAASKRRVSIQAASPVKRKKMSATAPPLPRRAPITATITFHDDAFLEGIVKRVSENIGDLMVSYYAGQSPN